MQLLKPLRFEAFAIFLCALCLFTVGLDQQEIIGFEARFYLFALEMYTHGVSWFPTTYLQPYADYPVTPTLFIYGMAKIFGSLNKFTAVLPSAIAAAATVSFTYLIGVLHERRLGLTAAFFMLLTYTFLMEARTISPDQYVTFVTVCCFYLGYSAEKLKKPKRMYWIPLLLLFGFACRGPIGLVIPAGVLCTSYGWSQHFKKMFLWGAIALIVLFIASGLLFAIAYHVGGKEFALTVWHMQVAGRLENAYLPWYFYFSESFGAYALTYPLAIMIIAGWVFASKEHLPVRRLFILKLIGWVLVILIGLTIPAIKKPRYILAIAPALSLICSYLIVVYNPAKYFIILRKLTLLLCLFFPSLSLIGLVTCYYLSFKMPWHSHIDFLYVGIVLFVLQCVAGILFLRFSKQRFLLVGVAACAFVMNYVGLIEPINLATNATQQFVNNIETFRQKKNADLIFYQENPDGWPIKYLVNTNGYVQPIFLDKPDELVHYKKNLVLLVTSENFLHIPNNILKLFKIVQSGKVGHTDVILLEKI